MNIHIVTIGYGLAEDLDNLVRNTSSEPHDLTWHIFQHSVFPDVVEVLAGLKRLRKVTVNVYPYGENRGVAKSWNEGIINAYEGEADYVIISNDDMTVPDGDLDKLIDAAQSADRMTYLVTGMGHDVRMDQRTNMALGFGVLMPIAYEVVGMFDEMFIPAYFEDNDYDYRALRSGLNAIEVADTNMIHQGSKSLYTVPGQRAYNDVMFPLNKAYYRRKWGGEPGDERYERPFNDVRFGLRIAPCDRDRPYWGYERDLQAELR